MIVYAWKKELHLCTYFFGYLHRKRQIAIYKLCFSLGLRNWGKRNYRLLLFTLTILVLVDNFKRGIHHFYYHYTYV